MPVIIIIIYFITFYLIKTVVVYDVIITMVKFMYYILFLYSHSKRMIN